MAKPIWLALACFAVMALGAGAQGQTAAASASASAAINPQSLRQAQDLARQLLPYMDKDKNGKISKAEFMSFMEAEFNALDTAKTGELTVEQLSKSVLFNGRKPGGTGK